MRPEAQDAHVLAHDQFADETVFPVFCGHADAGLFPASFGDEAAARVMVQESRENLPAFAGPAGGMGQGRWRSRGPSAVISRTRTSRFLTMSNFQYPRVVADQDHADAAGGHAGFGDHQLAADAVGRVAVRVLAESGLGAGGLDADAQAVGRGGAVADAGDGRVDRSGATLFMPAMTITLAGPKIIAATRLPVPSMLTSLPSAVMALLLHI